MEKPLFKIPPSVAKDEIFKQRLKTKLIDWNIVKNSGIDVPIWWEYMVKTGIKELARERGLEIKIQRIGQLNVQKIRQAYLTTKVNNLC